MVTIEFWKGLYRSTWRGRSYIPKNVGMTRGRGAERGDFSPQLRDALSREFLILDWRRKLEFDL